MPQPRGGTGGNSPPGTGSRGDVFDTNTGRTRPRSNTSPLSQAANSAVIRRGSNNSREAVRMFTEEERARGRR